MTLKVYIYVDWVGLVTNWTSTYGYLGKPNLGTLDLGRSTFIKTNSWKEIW